MHEQKREIGSVELLWSLAMRTEKCFQRVGFRSLPSKVDRDPCLSMPYVLSFFTFNSVAGTEIDSKKSWSEILNRCSKEPESIL